MTQRSEKGVVSSGSRGRKRNTFWVLGFPENLDPRCRRQTPFPRFRTCQSAEQLGPFLSQVEVPDQPLVCPVNATRLVCSSGTTRTSQCGNAVEQKRRAQTEEKEEELKENKLRGYIIRPAGFTSIISEIETSSDESSVRDFFSFFFFLFFRLAQLFWLFFPETNAKGSTRDDGGCIMMMEATFDYPIQEPLLWTN